MLLPLVGGYLYIRGVTTLRYKIAREDGHRLYFRVAYHGVFLFITSLAILGVAYWQLHSCRWFVSVQDFLASVLRPLLKNPDQANGQLGFLLICLFSVFLGRVSPFSVNRVFAAKAEDALWDAASENELEEFLLDALAQAKSIAVTLTTGKVYVGFVLTTPEPRTERRVIALLPLMSGYREDDGRVIFTTYYDQFYGGDASGEDDFKLILPVDKMISLGYFDVAVYAKFSEANSSATTPRRVKIPARLK